MSSKPTNQVEQEAEKRLCCLFNNHQVELRVTDSNNYHVFECRQPKTSTYAFKVFFAPRTICVSGDIGDFVFNVSVADSLGWLLKACDPDREFSYYDYFVSKIRASDTPKEEFRKEDALQQLEHDLVCATEEDEYGLVQKIKTLITTIEDSWDYTEDEWRRDANEIFEDPRDCRGVSWGALTAWAACRAFTRLYRDLIVDNSVIK